MSMNPPEMSSVGTPPPPKAGMGRAAKVLIALGVGLGLLCLLCCGGVVFFFMRTVSTNPATVVAKTGEITQIDIPSGLKPKASFDMTVPFSGTRMGLWTVYADDATKSQLVLFALGDMANQGDPEEMRKGMEQSLEQQGMKGPQKIDVTESYTKEVEIRGEKATFTISKGTASGSDSPRIQVVGVFKGETGPAILVFDADAEKYPEEDVIKMIESIK